MNKTNHVVQKHTINELFRISSVNTFNYERFESIVLNEYSERNIDLKKSFDDSISRSGYSLFMLICKNSPDCVDICIKIFEIINDDKWTSKQIFERTNELGMTAFMYLCEPNDNMQWQCNNRVNGLKLVLKSKWFKPNYLRVQNITNGMTPLMYACLNENVNIVSVIINSFTDEKMFHDQLRKKNSDNGCSIDFMIDKGDINFIISHKWFTVNDLIQDNSGLAIKRYNTLGKIMNIRSGTVLKIIIDKLNKEQINKMLYDTDYSFITTSVLEYIVESKNYKFDVNDPNVCKIYSELIKYNKIIPVLFENIDTSHILKCISLLNSTDELTTSVILSIFELTKYDPTVVEYVTSTAYPNVLNQIKVDSLKKLFENNVFVNSLIKASITTSSNKIDKNNNWNLLMLCARYNPELLKMLLGMNSSEINDMKQYDGANMIDITIMEKYKGVIDNKYRNFTYLHILVLFNSDHLNKIKKFISNEDASKVDSNNHKFYEYLYLHAGENVNGMIECNVCMDNKRNTVIIPCGHTICDSCSLRINKCHVCQKYIVAKQKFFI